MKFQEFKELVVAHAQALGIADYELYYQASESVSVSAFKTEVDRFTSSANGGVCFRCIVNGKMGYASTEALSETEAVSVVDRAVDNASVLEAEEPVFLGEGGKTYAQVATATYELPMAEELIRTVLQTQQELYAIDPAVVDGSTTQGIAEACRIAIVNSRGLDLQYENNVAGLVVGAVVTDGKEKANDYQIKLGDVAAIDRAALMEKAVQTAKGKLGGEAAPTGNYPVVFDPEAMSGLLSVFAGIFSAEATQKGLSRMADKEGTKIAADCVTLVDDPFHKDNPMPIHFDAEGSPTARKCVIENGVLKTLLYNLKTAAVAGKTTTGNAAKAGYDAAVRVRPFTMHLACGDRSEQQLLEQAGNGVYINSLSGLHAGANAVSGDFSLQSAGFLIENGKKTAPVRGFTVAGNFYDLLQNITAVADNLELPSATGMTAFGSPSVLVEGLSIAGK